MMALIESLQHKAVEEGDTKVALDGNNDDEECANGDSEEDDDAMERDENDDISLDDVDQDSAGDKKTECPNDDSDVINIDGSVKIVVDIKEEREAVKKYNVGDGENGKGDKIKVSAPEVMAVLAEENPAKQTKGSKGPDNKESQPQPQKRKGNDTVGTNTAKRMRRGEANGSPAVSRVTRSSCMYD
jgi:E3 ubiquitin-protein ligase UHRF1